MNKEGEKATAKDWASLKGSVVGGSDRISQFSSSVCLLRDVTNEEVTAQIAELPQREHKDPSKPRTRIVFDQVMHVAYARSGESESLGIPLYHDRGMFRYEEIPAVIRHNDKTYNITAFQNRVIDEIKERRKGTMPAKAKANAKDSTTSVPV